MIKRQEISDPTSCLNKAADDEPVFVFRAQDQTAPWVIEQWLDVNWDNLSEGKREHARACIAAMRAWPTTKLPD